MFARITRIAHGAGIAAGVLGATLSLAPAALSQETTSPPAQTERDPNSGGAASRISGYVLDQNGAVIPFAVVSLTNQDTFEYHAQNASAEGFYEFRDLPPGAYKVKIEAGGFDPKEYSDIRLGDASEYRRDAQLGLQQVAEVVQVGGSDDKTESVSVGGAIVIESTNPLVEAVFREDLEDVKARVMMRARINSRDKGYDGMSPLHAAVETGNLEIAKFLLEHGAKPNIRDFQKRTPIMMLDEDASPEMLELLLRYGAKIQLVDKERNTVLHHFAAYDGQDDILRLLINQGVAVDAVNKDGETALMVAAENESVSNVKALLESGATVDSVNKEGKSVLELTSNEEVRSILASYGAVARAQ